MNEIDEIEDEFCLDNDEDQIETVCTCEPLDGDGYQSLQLMTIRVNRNGSQIAQLEAIRMAISCYDVVIYSNVVLDAFDKHTQMAYNLAAEIKKNSRKINNLYDCDSCGIIGIMNIEVDPSERGKQISTKMIERLKALHAGMTWHVALEAVPIEFNKEPRTKFLKMRKRLLAHYTRNGFISTSPRGNLMVALWDIY